MVTIAVGNSEIVPVSLASRRVSLLAQSSRRVRFLDIFSEVFLRITELYKKLQPFSVVTWYFIPQPRAQILHQPDLPPSKRELQLPWPGREADPRIRLELGPVLTRCESEIIFHDELGERGADVEEREGTTHAAVSS